MSKSCNNLWKMSSSLSDDEVQIIESEHDDVQPAEPSAVHLSSFFTFKAENGVGEGIELNDCSPNRSGTSVCNVIGCGFSMKGKSVRDLVHHLKMKHTFREYDQFLYMSGEKETHRNLPRAKHNSTLVHSFFKFDAKHRISFCTVSDCKVQISGKHSKHLTKHLEKCHPKEYSEFLTILNLKKKSQLPSAETAAKTKNLEDSSKSTQLADEKKPTENYDSEDSVVIVEEPTPSPYTSLYCNEKIKSDLEDLEIDVDLELPPTVLPETLPLDSPLAVFFKQDLPDSPAIVPVNLTCPELDEIILPALLSPPMVMNESVLQVDSSSYTNLRLVNSATPSLISKGEILSAEPFSVEIDLPNSDQGQPSDDEILLKAMTDIVDIIKQEPTLPGSNLILCDMPPLIPIQQNDEMIPQQFPITIEDDNLSESSTKDVFSRETNLLLREQIRKHVQLLTQTHLITVQQSSLNPLEGAVLRDKCRSLLHDLVPFKQRMDVTNLDEALDLVTHWETVVSKPCEFQKPVGVILCGEIQHPLNSELLKMMGESHVFMYPELLPKLAIYETKPETGLCSFSPYEDQLIAMGIEQFTPFCANLLIDRRYSLDYLVSSMISKHMLPQWTAEQIQMRINYNCLDISPENPIKYCMLNKMAPPLEHVIRPFHSTRKLRNVPLSWLPDRWRKLFVNSTVTVPSPVQLPSQQMICIASIASFSGTCPSVKVFPAKIVNSWTFGGVPGQYFPTSQIPSQSKLPTLFDSLYQKSPSTIPLYQQRHKPICKRRRIMQDFSTSSRSIHQSSMPQSSWQLN